MQTGETRIVRRYLSVICAVLALASIIGYLEQGYAATTAYAGSGKKNKTDAQMELGDVIKAIEIALLESQEHPVSGFPALKSVKVTVQTTVSRDVGGALKVFVFNIGGKVSSEGVSSLSFELKPPEEKRGTGVSSVKPEDITNALAREIQAAKVGFESAQRSSKTLKTSTVGISLGFTVTKEGTLGVDTGQLLPIGISASGNASLKSGNTIELEFAPKE